MGDLAQSVILMGGLLLLLSMGVVGGAGAHCPRPGGTGFFPAHRLVSCLPPNRGMHPPAGASPRCRCLSGWVKSSIGHGLPRTCFGLPMGALVAWQVNPRQRGGVRHFAAVSGSSAATPPPSADFAARTGVARLRQAYRHRFTGGCGYAGSTYPPSIVMIVRGCGHRSLIIRLFIAGILPGILLMALFSGYIGVWVLALSDAHS